MYMKTAEEKEKVLNEILKKLGSVVVAFSGGVDSTYLLYRARGVLGDKVLAVTSLSATFPASEQEASRALVGKLHVNHLEIKTDELSCREYIENSPERCYYCKRELLGKLKEIAARRGYAWVVHGANKDDEGDFRPGLRAAAEMGSRAPLQEAGLTKEEIRMLSRKAALPTWDKPSRACLSSRFPYGETITLKKLKQVEAAEEYLCTLGFSQCRVRYHGSVARLEVEQQKLARALDRRLEISNTLRNLGFNYVALDLEGFRSGSMNETLG
jgi:uncharacterized protein